MFKSRGVYAILDDKCLIYIGSTKHPFKKRFESHQRCFKQHSNKQKLYSYVPKGNLIMKPLICTDKIECYGRGRKRIIDMCEWMEWALILVFKPEYNMAGVSVPFTFGKRKKTRRRRKKEEPVSAF